jgi:hypothetical protein
MAVVFVRSSLAYFSANGVFYRDGERGYHSTPHVATLMAIGRPFYGSEYEIFGPICSDQFSLGE